MVLVFVLVVVTFFITIYIHINVLGSYLPKTYSDKNSINNSTFVM